MRSLRAAMISAFAIICALFAREAGAESADLPEAPGKQQVLMSCTQCHGIDVMMQRRSPEEWSQVVSLMIGNGAQLTDEEYNTIVGYLSANLALPTPAQAPTGS